MIVFLLLCLLLPSLASAHPLFTNEPVSATKFFECDFDDTLCGMDNHYNTQKFANMPSAYPGDPSVRALDNFMCGTCTTANGSWGVRWPIRRSVFLGMVWYPDLEGYTNNNNKVIFLRNGISDNSLLIYQGLPNQIGTLKWYMQGKVNNTHIPSAFGMSYTGPGTEGTGWFDPTEASAFVRSASGPHKVEVCLTASSGYNTRDGVIRVYVDGKRTTNITNANIAPEGLNEFQVNTTWDGQSTAQCKSSSNPGGRTCPREWHHYFSKVYLSNPTNGCNVGVTSEPPVVEPPPPVTPGAVTGITATIK